MGRGQNASVSSKSIRLILHCNFDGRSITTEIFAALLRTQKNLVFWQFLMKIRSFWSKKCIFERENGVLATGKLKTIRAERETQKKRRF